MKATVYIYLTVFLFSKLLISQTIPFKENLKWGIKENEKIIINPVYDTVFNFDATGKVCLACYKIKSASANKFIKVLSTTYSCNYFNRENKRLSVKTEGNDTCSVFTMNKNTVKLYSDNSSFFTVSVKNQKHLLNKNFEQLTYKGYYDIVLAADANYYVAQIKNEGDVILTGLIDLKETEVIPFNYSDIKMNRYDSLIIGCSAGIRPNGNDDVFNYKGQKIAGYHRHVDMATKNFIIYKIFEPKELYILYNISTKEEKNLNADEVRPSLHDEILLRLKNDWYLYDLNTNQKKSFKQS